MTTQTDRTTVKRLPARGHYDRETIDAILDEGYVCHMGFVVDGTPLVIPTLYARDGDSILVHGSAASRSLRHSRGESIEMCLTVTLVDGFVMARSGFHHSMNYRSVVVIGDATEITVDDEKAAALDHLVDTVAPGRVEAARPMTRNELKGTIVLRLPLDEASAKVRDGGPVDDDEDYDLPIWAGVVPIITSYGEPITDPNSKLDLPIPDHIANFSR